MGGDLNVKLE